MKQPDLRFWRSRPQTSIVATMAMLAGLLFVLVVLKKYGAWPIHEDSDTTVPI